MVADGTQPWVLSDIEWDGRMLRTLVDGGSTKTRLAELAKQKFGTGDLVTLIERDRLRAKTRLRGDVFVWTLDRQLQAFAGESPIA